MSKIAYLANHFPCAVEPYVVDEILELKKRGVEVIPCSAWPTEPGSVPQHRALALETVAIVEAKWGVLLRALWVCTWRFPCLWEFIVRIVFCGKESAGRRFKALLHTFLGVYYAQLLKSRDVQHIHVHHGYFSAWVAMVAAHLLGIHYSMTLHGSDILVHDAYLDIKLKRCSKCFTVSEYNRNYLLARFPFLDPRNLVVQRLGVDTSPHDYTPLPMLDSGSCLTILAVGRLHRVKNHAFLVDACAELKRRGMNFVCMIAGDGPERQRLQRQVDRLGLKSVVKFLGHLEHADLDALYPMIDLFVLTSRSEGIPLVLMEAMSWGRVVLAPAITGIPELVRPGRTGFLYQEGVLADFVAQVEAIRQSLPRLGTLQNAARAHVVLNFDRSTNLESFISILLSQICHESKRYHAHPVLQQI